MKKSLRMMLAVAVTLGIVNFQSPAKANCQMSSGLVAAACKMPCCAKTRMPLNCPMLKQAPPRDAISLTSEIKPVVLVFLHSLEHICASLLAPATQRSEEWTLSFYRWMFAAEPPGRSPPAVLPIA